MSDGRPGRPLHAPTENTQRQVEMLASFGNTEDQIAQIVGISHPTLRRHYKQCLELGHIKANNAVAKNLFRQAIKDDQRAFPAIKFWLNCRAGWSEYAPPPAALEPKPGKKEQAQRAADTAEEGTEWSHLVH